MAYRTIDTNDKKKLTISFNSPVILGFTIICFIAYILNVITHGVTNRLLFSVYHSSLVNPLTYVRMFGHVFGHANWSHFMGNITLLLVVGPLLEEKYGSGDIAVVIGSTALITGLVHYIFAPHSALLGASGVVFAMILLSSFTSIKEGHIPLTFILVAVLYLGGEIVNALTVHNNVSNLTHIIGGVVGSGFGYMLYKDPDKS